MQIESMINSNWSGPSPEPPPPIMIRSKTELELERFFGDVSPPAAGCVAAPSTSAASQLSTTKLDDRDDEVVAIEKPPTMDLSSKAKIESDEYRRFLKNKLALECAAYALREPSVKPGDSNYLAKNQLQAPISVQLGVHHEDQGTGPSFSMAQNETPREPFGISTLPDMQNKQVRQTTSESSREESDDELERDTETTDNLGPQDVKRARRMHSNRESARRSRRRKQALLSELEEQVEELRKDKNALLQRQNSWNRKYGDATVEHRILNAEIEALRAKVRMSEEQVKQVSGGYNPAFLAMPKGPLAMQTNPDQVFHHSMSGITHNHQRFDGHHSNNTVSFAANQQNGSVGNIMEENSAMQHVGSVHAQHTQKQTGAGSTPSRGMPGWDLPGAHTSSNRQN